MKYFLLYLISLTNFFLFSQKENQSNTKIELQNNAVPSVNGTFNSVNNSNATYLWSQPVATDSVQFKNNAKIESKAKQNKDQVTRKSENILKKTSQLNSTYTNYSSVQKKAKTQSTQRSPTEEQQSQINELAEDMISIDPNSVVSNISFYEAGNYDVKRSSYIDNASKISPNHPDVLKYKVANAIILRDSAEAKVNLNAMAAQHVLTPEIQLYGQDIVQSACGNSTLITHGFIDNYGATFSQLNNTATCDHQLTIVSLDFLQSETYREVLKQKGYELPANEKVDVAYLKDFCEKNEAKKIALSMTIPRPYLEPLVPKLSPVGIVFEYRVSPERTFNEIEYCWNAKLNKKNIRGYSSPTSNSLSANYLPSMFFILNYYRDTGQLKKQAEMESEIQYVKQKAGLLQKKKGY